MAADPVLDAIRAALADDPTNGELRLHLAGLLEQRGRSSEALDEATIVLRDDPAHVAALRVAASAARATGDVGRADQYDLLLSALGEGTSEHLSTQDDDSGGPGIDPIPDSADALLARWNETEPVTEVEVGELTAPGVRLADIGGMQAVKDRLQRSFLRPMENPELQASFGKSMRGGLLLWGPPGCGKTFIARALAGELGADFYEIGLSDVLDMWIGASERNLSGIFDVARANRPCLLFFDEIDALGMKRTNLRAGGAAMRGVVNQLLSELDGATSDNEGIFVLAATNHPWDVDPALLRPGRFDRQLLVLPPDAAAREAILRVHLRGRPTERLDLGQVARRTDGYSGADLALVCEEATESALDRSLDTGTTVPISQPDLLAAIGGIRSSIDAWLDVARNFCTYNNEDGRYDELVDFLAAHSARQRGRRARRRGRDAWPR